MSTAEADAVKRQALRVVHLWMDAADAAALAADPLGLRQPVELPREGDFEPTDYGDTGNLSEALYRYSRHPWYRSNLPWAIERAAAARRDQWPMRQRRPREPTSAERQREYQALEDGLE